MLESVDVCAAICEQLTALLLLQDMKLFCSHCDGFFSQGITFEAVR